MSTTRAALFLDRDGVLIRDAGLLTGPDEIELLFGVVRAIKRAQEAGLVIVVVTNQSVVARGLCTEEEVAAVHARIDAELAQGGAARLDGYRFCPHHPHADLEAYRLDCECRKPKPGMLVEAATSLSIDLSKSVMVGDRPTDILAGHRAGCQTILVESPMSTEPLIVGARPDELVEPTHRATDLESAIAVFLAPAQP